MKVEFTIPSSPVTKARPRFNTRTGRAFTDDKTRIFENIVSLAYGSRHYFDDNYIRVRIKFKFEIPKGYCYDGATIPRFFWRIIGSNTDNKFLIAALIHDVLCENHHYIDNDRYFSTQVFNALLEVSEVFPLKRFFMKHSVDIFQRFCEWR